MPGTIVSGRDRTDHREKRRSEEELRLRRAETAAVATTEKSVRTGGFRPGRYYTGIAIGIVSVLMFFMALASAFLVRKGGPDWIPVHIPRLLWVNTVVLIASSGALWSWRESGWRRSMLEGFKRFWLVTTILG